MAATKAEFLAALRNALSGMPQEDLEKTLEYYEEMIDDRTEDGDSEEAAVAGIGDISEIAAGIRAETAQKDISTAASGASLSVQTETPAPAPTPAPSASFTPLPPEKPRRNRSVLPVVLLILGAPLWLPLLAAALIIVLSIFLALLTVVVALYAATVSVAAGAILSLIAAVPLFFTAGGTVGTFYLGAGICCAGICILLFLLSTLFAKGMLLLCNSCFRAVKRGFSKG